MMKWLYWLIDLTRPRLGARSPEWRSVRNAYVAKNPCCELCGTVKNVEVHHIEPFHVSPELELEEHNLMTLCRRDHFMFGHLGSWRRWNSSIVYDISMWGPRFTKRK